jgi:putative transposase
MPEISRLVGRSGWIDMDFVEREQTPERAMKLGIQSHVAGLSISNTVSLLESLGVERSRKAVHDWVPIYSRPMVGTRITSRSTRR